MLSAQESCGCIDCPLSSVCTAQLWSSGKKLSTHRATPQSIEQSALKIRQKFWNMYFSLSGNYVPQTEPWLSLHPKFMFLNRTLEFSVKNICAGVHTDFTCPSRTVGEYLTYIFVNKWQTQVVFPDKKQQFASEVNSCPYPWGLEIACSFTCFLSFPSY